MPLSRGVVGQNSFRLVQTNDTALKQGMYRLLNLNCDYVIPWGGGNEGIKDT